MPLLDIRATKKVVATCTLEESTAILVDKYAAFIHVPADDVISKALDYVFSKDKEFQQYLEINGDHSAPSSLRIKRNVSAKTNGRRARKPSFEAVATR
jgi:3-methyladenine DNA glycosylase/8-oxoguanine DNA glycosylase